MDLGLQKIAMSGGEFIEGMEPFEGLVFNSIRLIGIMYRLKIISRDQASIEKERVLDFEEKLMKKTKSNDYFDCVANAAIAYKENPSIESADRFYNAFFEISE